MKKILLLFLCFACLASVISAQKIKRMGSNPVQKNTTKQKPSSFKLEQFTGKWQEVKRMGKNQQPVTINDTLFIFFKEAGKVETRDGTKSIIRGEASVEPGDILVAGADLYKIIYITETELVLDNQEEFIHTFLKKEQFWHETLGKSAIEKETYTNPVTFSLTNLKGKWHVYRRDAKPGSIKPGTALVSTIHFSVIYDETNAEGAITFSGTDGSETQPCKIKVLTNQLEIKTANQLWLLPVYKATETELIFGKANELLYFAKKL